jgi:hypothetical protein
MILRRNRVTREKLATQGQLPSNWLYPHDSIDRH